MDGRANPLVDWKVVGVSGYLFVYLPVYLSIYLFVYSSIYLSGYLSIYRYIYLSVYVSASVYLSVICLFVYLFVLDATTACWYQYVLPFFPSISLKYCPCHEKMMLGHTKCWQKKFGGKPEVCCSKMQAFSEN